MLIFDFFSGTRSATQVFKDYGHRVITFELDPQFEATETVDIMTLTPEYLMKKYGLPDFIWASPPCTAFSVASIGKHWKSGGSNPEPKTEAARYNQEIVRHTIHLITELAPRLGYLIENPRGMLRKLSVVQHLPRRTITYCQYGDSRMKPTDLWGDVPGWTPRPHCKNGDKCHTPAPRGSTTGTQGINGAKDRSRVPYDLGKEILIAMEEQ